MKKLDLENPIIRQDMEAIYDCGADFGRLDHKKILVTGASGMIASYLVLFLVYLKEYRNIDCHIIAEVRNKEKLRGRFGDYLDKGCLEVFEGDVLQFASEYEGQVDYMVHAASLASPQYYGTNPVETMLPNIIGTYHLLERMRKEPGEGFLFFSSGSVYGSVENAESLREDLAGPLQYLAPGNVYGESKRCGEALCMAYFREYQVPVRIARIHHTYGPTMDHQNDKRVFSSFVRDILEGNDIVMKSDGSARRAFCYITDMIAGLLLVLLGKESGEVYNIANEQQYISIKELAETLVSMYPEKKLSVKIQLERKDGYCPSTEKRIIPVNCDKIEALGWHPQVTVEEGFRRTIDFLL